MFVSKRANVRVDTCGCMYVCMYVCQGRRRLLKSGPAEEVITRGGERERGDYSPSRKGGFGASLEEIFEFWALLCAFLMGIYAFGTEFDSHKLFYFFFSLFI